MTTEVAVQQLINALSLGSLYALLALGLAMVYSVLRLMNFAYGELVTAVGYTIYFLYGVGLPYAVAAAAGVAAAIGVSLLTEMAAFRPLRKASFTAILFSSFAMSVLLQNLIRQAVSPRPRGIAVPAVLDSVVSIGSFRIATLSLVTLVLSLTAIGLLVTFLQRTRAGIAIRAAAANFEVARLVGIPANRVISLSFVVSGLLAGIGGVLWVSRIGGVTPTMGFKPVLSSFISVVIGGLGNLWGAVVGGFVLAFLEVALQVLLPPSTRPFIDAFALLIVVVILGLRPEGLVGRKEAAR